jgi:hypothetical protein
MILSTRVIRGEAPMNIEWILEELAKPEGLPVEAIRAAEADRAVVVPVFLRVIEDYLSGDMTARAKPARIFFIFHMLGSWHEKSAYRPLARLLALPSDEFELLMGDGVMDTAQRVMAAVFDGDPQPLYDVILNKNSDEYVRSSLLEAVGMVAVRGDMARAEAIRFLHTCFAALQSEPGCFVWHGWQRAIALLGLEEMEPLVKQAFDRKWIDPSWLSFEDFMQDLRVGVEQPGAPVPGEPPDEFTLFGDTIEELSTWYCFSPEYEENKRRAAEAKASRKAPLWGAAEGTAINPFRDIGRNDPCPCGSGKKFKKCCLDAFREAPFQGKAA